ncbi:unnamed protein product [Trifolium pratense]|uniref:Uncharacterized protein n=1 Tax=Trifolium pratense TaxID=57577 RepID=A0ACB0KH72_TRIPR|nr:unnamed protein product [Trifolium pratense]
MITMIVKQKKPKISKVTVAEAAEQIDGSYLEAFLGGISAAFEQEEDIQMMRFADFFTCAFSDLAAYQFPWVKLFRKKPLSKNVDSQFVTYLAVQLTSKFSVAKFVGLAMVLRRKPDALISVLPKLRENTKYQGQFKLLVITWMVAQASVGDLSVGLYAWSRILLPIVVGESGNPQSRDLVLQLVEKILSTPEARPVLVNGAVRRGEQLIPPPAFETLIHVTFPSSHRVKIDVRVLLATERFALIRKDNPELSKEAVSIVIWCFSRSTKCYEQWEKVYQYNIVGSVAVLKKISDDLEVQATKLSPYEPLRKILKHFRKKNKKALATETDAAHHAHFKDADKYCKIIA